MCVDCFFNETMHWQQNEIFWRNNGACGGKSFLFFLMGTCFGCTVELDYLEKHIVLFAFHDNDNPRTPPIIMKLHLHVSSFLSASAHTNNNTCNVPWKFKRCKRDGPFTRTVWHTFVRTVKPHQVLRLRKTWSNSSSSRLGKSAKQIRNFGRRIGS